MTIDEALLSVGEFGRGQLRQFCLVSLVWVPGESLAPILDGSACVVDHALQDAPYDAPPASARKPSAALNMFPLCAPAAIQTLVTVFLAEDPVARRWWRCVEPGDKVCEAALLAPMPHVCTLPREAWQWTRR